MDRNEPIKIWSFVEAPEEYRKLSTNGGDEDWVALVPNISSYKYGGLPLWLSQNYYFDSCNAPEEIYLDDDYLVLIGSHA